MVRDFGSEGDKIKDKNVNPDNADVARLDAERKLKERRAKELSAPQMKDLKQASLKFFDEWRGKVIERVGEVINSKQEAKSQMKTVDPPESKMHAPADTKINAGERTTHKDTAGASLEKLYPPIDTKLSSLPEKSRILIIHSALLLVLSLEHYIAPSRVLLLHMTSSLRLPLKVLTEDEEKMAKGLLEAAKHMSAESETQKKVEENKSSRKWQVGLASVAGAALIGVTGGLAAPLVAAGVGSVMGGLGLGATAAAGYLGTVAGSSVIVGGLFGAYGGRMTGQMMDNYAREVEDFAFLPVRKDGKDIDVEEEPKQGSAIAEKADAVSQKLTQKSDSIQESKTAKAAQSRITARSHDSQEDKEGVEDPAHRRLRVTIGITGWLTSKAEVVTPWRVIGHNSEIFALRWELEALMTLGNSLDAMVGSAAWSYASSEIIQRTIFAELASALWPVSLLQVARVVDNPFSVAKARADKAGEVLADALINKAQGERPVTLVGYSLGARVVYSCLTSLARRRAFGLIESVVLIGAPTPSTTADWRVLRSVVASRLVNVYSANDYILGFLYRTSSIQYGVAGLQKVDGIPSVENVDVSQNVDGHLRYRYLTGSILKNIGFEDINVAEVGKEEAIYKKMLEDEKKKTYTKAATEESQKVLENNPLGVGVPGDEPKKAVDSGKSEEQKRQERDAAETEAAEMEAQVKEKTQKGMLQSAWGYLPLRLQGRGAPSASGEQPLKKGDKPADGAMQAGKVEAAMGQESAHREGEGSWANALTSGFLGGNSDSDVAKGSKESLVGKDGGSWAESLSGGFLGGSGHGAKKA